METGPRVRVALDAIREQSPADGVPESPKFLQRVMTSIFPSIKCVRRPWIPICKRWLMRARSRGLLPWKTENEPQRGPIAESLNGYRISQLMIGNQYCERYAR
jgi:hypothetical protein